VDNWFTVGYIPIFTLLVSKELVMMHRLCLGWAVLVLVTPLAVAAPAPDTINPLSLVPKDAFLAVQVRGLERSKERFLTLLKSSMPELAPLLRGQIDEGLRFLLNANGRELKGVSKDGSLLLVFTGVPKSLSSFEDLVPVSAILVPVTSFTEFRNGILTEDERKALKEKEGYQFLELPGAEVCFVDRKDGYAVVTFDKKLAARFVDKINGLDKILAKDLSQKFLDADVSAWMNLLGFNDTHGKDIDQLKKSIVDGLGFLPETSDFVEIVKMWLDPGFQLFTECENLIVTTEFRAEGLALGAIGEFATRGQYNTTLKDAQPTALDEMAKLPPGFAGYSITQIRPDLFKDHGRLLLGILGNPEVKETRKAAQMFLDAGPKLRLDATGFPWQGVQVWMCEDPAKAAAAQVKLFESLMPGHSYLGIPIKERPKVNAAAQKHAGFELNHTKLVWDLDEIARRLEIPANTKEFLDFAKAWIGEEMNIWFGTDGKRVVLVTGKDWDVASGHLDRYLKGEKTLGDQQAFKEVRKGLPSEATTIILADAPLCTATFFDSLKPIFAMFGGNPLPEPFQVAIGQGKTNYVGLSLGIRPRRLSADLFVPVPTAKEIYRLYFEKMVKDAVGPPN
jgi:hypothetical protein